MHTHFSSGTMMLATLLNVLLALTFWKLAWGHAARSFPNNQTVQALAGAAFFQAG